LNILRQGGKTREGETAASVGNGNKRQTEEGPDTKPKAIGKFENDERRTLSERRDLAQMNHAPYGRKLQGLNQTTGKGYHGGINFFKKRRHHK